MIRRLKNLWNLSKYRPHDTPEGFKDAEGKPLSLLVPDIEKKPKGKAVIIDTSTPLDMFPEEKDI